MATWAATLDAALALEPDHLSLYALTLDDPDAEGLTGPERRPPADAGRAPAAGASARAADQDDDRAAAMYQLADRPPRRGRLARVRDLATGPGPATRAATTSPTGSAGRTRPSGPAPTPSTARTRRWNAARLDALHRRADAGRRAAADACRRAAREPAGRRRPPRPRRVDPRPAHRRRRAASAAVDEPPLGDAPSPGPPTPGCVDGRPDDRPRPDDPRPAPLERAVRPARLSRSATPRPR